jgi:hypothetical protein
MIGFGAILFQEEFDFDGLKRATRDIEHLGYDSVWLYDRFYPMSKRNPTTIRVVQQRMSYENSGAGGISPYYFVGLICILLESSMKRHRYN